MEKKKWVSPVLTVLTRGEDRSESILSGCKSYVPPGLGPGASIFNCKTYYCDDEQCWCTYSCYTWGAS